MAIKFGMTIADMIRQLTRGFRSVAGRDPDGLEKIKIKQEAVQRFKDMNKVVDMEGKAIDTSKGIMGGRQIQDSPEFGKKVRETYDAAKGPGKGQEMVDALKSPGAKKSYKIMEDQLGVKLYGDESFEEILEIQRTGKHPRGEPKAEGGRIGLAKGMTKRAFLKLMGGAGAGIAALKSGFLGMGKGAGKEVAKEVVQKSTTTPPSYFFELAEKIKILGRESKVTTQSRVKEIDYKNYSLQEDITTGDMTIVKRKGDPEFNYEEEVMTLRKGQADEMTKGRTPPDEYEELTVRPDRDGKMKDVEDGIEPNSIQEIVEEVGQGGGNVDQLSLEEIARGKLAGGGIAMMLGE